MINNKDILMIANGAIDAGNYEGFLVWCTEDTTWEFVGDQTLQGKEAVRQWMMKTYLHPPVNIVHQLIAEGDFVTAIGRIMVKGPDGAKVHSTYCDVWRFEDGKMAALKAFVVEDKR